MGRPGMNVSGWEMRLERRGCMRRGLATQRRVESQLARSEDAHITVHTVVPRQMVGARTIELARPID